MHLVTCPALARSIGFFNIYHQSWVLIEQGETLIHYGILPLPMTMSLKST